MTLGHHIPDHAGYISSSPHDVGTAPSLNNSVSFYCQQFIISAVQARNCCIPTPCCALHTISCATLALIWEQGLTALADVQLIWHSGGVTGVAVGRNEFPDFETNTEVV